MYVNIYIYTCMYIYIGKIKLNRCFKAIPVQNFTTLKTAVETSKPPRT